VLAKSGPMYYKRKDMKNLILAFTAFIFFGSTALAQDLPPVESKFAETEAKDIGALPDLPAFTEYFILDEIRTLRVNHETLRRDINKDLNERELRMSDRALSYVSNAVTYFSFFLTLSLGLFAVFGWRTVKDLKSSAKAIVEAESNKLLEEFRGRLEVIETDLKTKGEEMISQQAELERVQHINGLWLSANKEKDDRKKLDILEEIRELEPENEEPLVAKAASYLRLDLPEQALEVSELALELSADQPTAVYNKACANAQLGNTEEALAGLHHAIQLSDHFKESAREDRDFEALRKNKEFKDLVAE